jgi:hypothetical protein
VTQLKGLSLQGRLSGAPLNKIGQTTIKDAGCILCGRRMQDGPRTDIRGIRQRTCTQPRKVHTACWNKYVEDGEPVLEED